MGSALHSVTIGDEIRPPRTIVYGTDKIGKTTFAAGAPAPIFLRSEDGLGVLQVPAFPPAQSLDDVLGAVAALITEPHVYRTLVIDSLDWLERIVWAHTAKHKGVAHLEDLGYGKGYLFADEHWRYLLKGLDRLRSDRRMGIILICHSEIRRFDAPDSAPYDRYQLKLHKRAAALVSEWADVIGFAHFDTIIRESDVGFNKKVTRADDDGRVLFLVEKPAFDAGNRYGLPDKVRLEYSAYRDALKEALPARTSAAPEITLPEEMAAHA